MRSPSAVTASASRTRKWRRSGVATAAGGFTTSTRQPCSPKNVSWDARAGIVAI